MGDDFIPLEKAAARSGLHPNTLRRLLRQSEIRGYKDGWRWMVSASSLRRYTDPVYGFLLELPGPKMFLSRREENSASD